MIVEGLSDAQLKDLVSKDTDQLLVLGYSEEEIAELDQESARRYYAEKEREKEALRAKAQALRAAKHAGQ